ncbi:MAG: ABC transporter permease, partial [Rhodobacteraceae bacterium]|nr:ABC transporter permease [Paracoccaceae bacterium]
LVSKVQGNIVDTLMPPLSAGEILAGYLAGALGRGLLVAVAIWAMEAAVLGVGLAHPLWALAFVLAGSALMGAVGVLAGIHATKFDHMAAMTNFVIVPLSFLSGTFYSAAALPGAMQVLTHLNPVFYLIDGVRYGVLGVSDASPVLGMAVCLGITAALLALAWYWLRIGYRLKT